MSDHYHTGNASVDAMTGLQIQGNMVPFAWYQTILRPNGKPYLLAIIILADLVYWFKPVEVLDEVSGRFLGWRKRFKADLLQKSYKSYEEVLGESRHSIKTAMDALEDLGVIRREFREIRTPGGIANNVMFIDLDVDILKKLTYPEMAEEVDKCNQEEQSDTPPLKFSGRVVQNSDGGSIKVLRETPTEKCRTNTENTTETTTESPLPINQPADQRITLTSDRYDVIDRRKAYEELIRENICYDVLMEEADLSVRGIFENLYTLICDVVCQERSTIRVDGYDMPCDVVRSRFLKLNMEHLRYAAYAISNTTTKVVNIRAYMLTTLYHAPETMHTYWSQKANHDLYSGAFLEGSVQRRNG